MKICVIVIMALYSAITSAKPHPEKLYERWYGKCTNVKEIQRHPVQLYKQHRSCFSSEHPTMYITSCSGNLRGDRDRQYFQFKNSKCKG